MNDFSWDFIYGDFPFTVKDCLNDFIDGLINSDPNYKEIKKSMTDIASWQMRKQNAEVVQFIDV